jgi:hypothetical protein
MGVSGHSFSNLQESPVPIDWLLEPVWALKRREKILVRFEVFTAVTMKNAVFWDVVPCRYCVNRRFGGTYRFHFHGMRNPRVMNQREQVAADGGDTFLRNVG